MKEKRVDMLLSIASFLQLMFLGFAGSFAAELLNDQKNEAILFLTSLAALILIISIVYLYTEIAFITRS